jgi:transposase
LCPALIVDDVVGRVARVSDGWCVGRQPEVGKDASDGVAFGDDGDDPQPPVALRAFENVHGERPPEKPLIPPLPVRDDGKGRPWKHTRDVLNGILWVMRTGAPWKDMPARYPPYATCHRRFSGWVRDGTLRKIVETLAREGSGRAPLERDRPERPRSPRTSPTRLSLVLEVVEWLFQ